jgi:hypothetical protein
VDIVDETLTDSDHTFGSLAGLPADRTLRQEHVLRSASSRMVELAAPACRHRRRGLPFADLRSGADQRNALIVTLTIASRISRFGETLASTPIPCAVLVRKRA